MRRDVDFIAVLLDKTKRKEEGGLERSEWLVWFG